MNNVIIVGRKPGIRYVTAIITIFNSGKKEVVVRARGRNISTSVDVVNMLRRSFLSELTIKDVKIGTETVETGGKTRYVSFIEITLRVRG